MHLNLALLALYFILGLVNDKPEIRMVDPRTEYVLDRINAIRGSGCQCGDNYMEAVHDLQWNDTLESTAYRYARQMDYYKFFSHRSPDGKDVGERLDDAGYRWRYAGENLAKGQKNFEETLKDWLESPSHCRMLMNPRMKEMGLARYGDYWVQHLGTRMPSKAVRTEVYYREG